MKKLISILLVILLVMSLPLPAFAADKAEAVTIRLAKTDGNGVSVTTNADKEVKTSVNMRLFSGYKVKTDKVSYAFLSLDEKKAVKLDKATAVEIKKSGDKNEVYISAGQLFFDVKEKLGPKEEMNIFTSNMSMGIRGTSGVVNVTLIRNSDGTVKRSLTNVQLYEGTLTLTVVNPATKKDETLTLEPGQQLIIEDYTAIGDGKVEIKECTASDVPYFASVEIINDEELAQRILNDSGININDLQSMLNDALKTEAEKLELKEKQENEGRLAIADLMGTDYTDAGSGSGSASSGSGSSGSAGSGSHASRSEGSLSTQFASSYTLPVGATEADLINALNTYASVTVPYGGNITLSAPFTLLSDKTLIVDGTINAAVNVVTVNGTLYNNGTVTGTGTGKIINNGFNSFYNKGTLIMPFFINNGKYVHDGGTFTGSFELDGIGSFVNNTSATFSTVNVLSSATGAQITNQGTIGTLSSAGPATLDNYGGNINSLQVSNYLTLTRGYVQSSTQSIYIQSGGSMTIPTGVNLTLNGTVACSGIMNINGSVTNNTVINTGSTGNVSVGLTGTTGGTGVVDTSGGGSFNNVNPNNTVYANVEYTDNTTISHVSLPLMSPTIGKAATDLIKASFAKAIRGEVRLLTTATSNMTFSSDADLSDLPTGSSLILHFSGSVSFGTTISTPIIVKSGNKLTISSDDGNFIDLNANITVESGGTLELGLITLYTNPQILITNNGTFNIPVSTSVSGSYTSCGSFSTNILNPSGGTIINNGSMSVAGTTQTGDRFPINLINNGTLTINGYVHVSSQHTWVNGSGGIINGSSSYPIAFYYGDDPVYGQSAGLYASMTFNENLQPPFSNTMFRPTDSLRLQTDTILTRNLSFWEHGRTMNLDLNGYTISTSSGYFIDIGPGVINLSDSSPAKTGMFTAVYDDSFSDAAVDIDSNLVVNLDTKIIITGANYKALRLYGDSTLNLGSNAVLTNNSPGGVALYTSPIGGTSTINISPGAQINGRILLDTATTITGATFYDISGTLITGTSIPAGNYVWDTNIGGMGITGWKAQ